MPRVGCEELGGGGADRREGHALVPAGRTASQESTADAVALTKSILTDGHSRRAETVFCVAAICCCPPPGLEITTSLQSKPTAFKLGSKMDSEGNKKRKLENVGGQDVETVKAFDKPRAPLTATAGELKHPSQGLCHCKRSLPLFRQEKSSRCLMQ